MAADRAVPTGPAPMPRPPSGHTAQVPSAKPPKLPRHFLVDDCHPSVTLTWMEIKPKDPRFYVDAAGKAHAEDWLAGLKDLPAKATITARLARIRRGLLGDCERYQAITELKIDFGPGYRVYTVEDGAVLVILLCGGDKSDQKKDFKKARRLADEYHQEKKTGAAKLRPLPDQRA